MAYSIQQFTSTGAEDHVVLTFPYLDKVDVHLYGAGVEAPFVWASGTRINFNPFPAGTEVVVRRLTQRDRVRYLLQEGAPFTRNILDQIHTQALYLAQESIEGAWFDMYGDTDMHGFRIRNAGAPELPQDYTTRAWVEAQILSAELGDSALADQVQQGLFERARRDYASVGYSVVGTFQNGFTIQTPYDLGIDMVTGKGYTGPIGTVQAGTNPALGGFVDRSTALLSCIPSLTYAGIRAYSGPLNILQCVGRAHLADNAQGLFYLDSNDITTPDNDCTVLVGVGGARWKRKYNVIDGVLVDWAGADPTGATQSDSAFAKAVSSGVGIRLNGQYVVAEPVIITASNGFFIKGSNRVSDSVTKTTLTAPNITRTYGGASFVYDVPCVFAFVADDDSYVRHVFIEDISTYGASGDLTQVHFFAPKASYCSFRNILATHGKTFWQSTVNGFINSFENVRTALFSKHFYVSNSNAYTLVNVYANGNPAGGDSVAYEFINTNAACLSCDCDGLNIGWVADGHSNLEVTSSNSEARLRIFTSRGTASINVHGGRHSLSVITSQQAQEAAVYRAEGASTIKVFGAKAHKFVFDASPTNKFLAITTGSARVCITDPQLAVGDEVAAEVFTVDDVLATASGEVVVTQAGSIVKRVISSTTAADFQYTTTRRLYKSVDFSAGLVQPVLTLTGLSYNQMLLATVELLYQSTGINGVSRVAGVSTCKLVASTRASNTVALTQHGTALSPDTSDRTVVFTASTTGDSVSIVATASHVSVGECSFMLDVNAVIAAANRTAGAVVIV